MDPKKHLKRKYLEEEESSMSNKHKLEENLSDSDDPSGGSPKRKMFGHQSSSELANEFIGFGANRKMEPKSEPTTNTSASSGSSYAAKMMRKMGYEEGRGLGKESQGIVKPIEESNQQGKRGLGFSVKNFDKRIEWNFENDPVSAYETPEWVENINEDVPSLSELKQWKKMGPKKRILDDEDKFCSKETLKQVLECKSIFDNLDDREMRFARSRANPFESIGSRFFQNRAALKMANIDAVFDFMFTEPKNRITKTSKVEKNEPLYFCDVCAGPGGFSEYVLWRKKWRAKGFGFTLKGDNDFKLNEFMAGAPEYFEPHYGLNGVNGDGDVTRSQNLKEFQKFVVAQTNHSGVHFMMADGGFSVEGNENIQEILSKQLYLCQFLCALSVLRPGGNFVCKLFDLFTPFSVGLVYLMYLCFDRICIHKPVTSRPANSERYIICESARESKAIIYDYLFHINDTLNETFANEKSPEDVESIVPMSVIKADKKFFDYIYRSNENIGKVQVLNLKKIQAFATNKNMFDLRQSQLIEECLNYWQIPNQTRIIYADDEQKQEFERKGHYKRMRGAKVVPKPVDCRKLMDKFDFKLRNTLLLSDMNSLGLCKISEIDERLIEDNFKKCSVYDYKCTMACGSLVLLFGCGGTNVFEFELTSPLNSFKPNDRHYTSRSNEWRKLESLQIELPKETLILAEKLIEYRGIDEKQIKSSAIHVIDMYFVEGENMMDRNAKITSIEERHADLEVFVKSITKNSRNDLNKVRVKDLVDIDKIQTDILENLIERRGKFEQDYKHAIHIPLSFASEYYVYPTGIYFLKHIQSPWSICRSKSTRMFYYYNSDMRSSTYVVPDERFFYSNPKYYLDNMLVWRWPKKSEEENDLDNHRIDHKTFLSLMAKYN